MSMAKEEAIAFLTRYVDNEYYTPQCQEAHRMAIAALREQKEALTSCKQWIPVTERLPIEEARKYFAMYEEWPEFIVLIKGAERSTTLMFDGINWTNGFDIYNVDHWMPLPEPPKGD